MLGEEKRVLMSIFLLDPEKKLLVSFTSITYSRSLIDAVIIVVDLLFSFFNKY